MSDWLPIKSLPEDTWPIALSGVITCDCGEGGIVVIAGGVQGGKVITECRHSVEWKYWMPLKLPPVEKERGAR